MNRLWTVECEEFAGDSDSVMRTGNIYQIANGYMGYRGTLDEYGRGELVAVTLAGLFDGVGDAWREPVNAPNGGFTQLALDGEPTGTALISGVRSSGGRQHLEPGQRR